MLTESEVDQVHQGITCQYCLNPFNDTTSAPLALVPCGHTMCAVCLTGHQKRNLKNCPSCKTQFTSWIKNFEVIKMFTNQPDETALRGYPVCKATKQPETEFCWECNTTICVKCKSHDNPNHTYSMVDRNLVEYRTKADADIKAKLTSLESYQRAKGAEIACSESTLERISGMLPGNFLAFDKIVKHAQELQTEYRRQCEAGIEVGRSKVQNAKENVEDLTRKAHEEVESLRELKDFIHQGKFKNSIGAEVRQRRNQLATKMEETDEQLKSGLVKSNDVSEEKALLQICEMISNTVQMLLATLQSSLASFKDARLPFVPPQGPQMMDFPDLFSQEIESMRYNSSPLPVKPAEPGRVTISPIRIAGTYEPAQPFQAWRSVRNNPFENGQP